MRVKGFFLFSLLILFKLIMMCFSFIMVANDANMGRKGLRRTSLSKYNEIVAGDELRIPLNPFLAILHVVRSFLFYHSKKVFFSIGFRNPLFS